MSQCNYCTIRAYKRRAKERGNKIVLRSSNFMGGISVFEITKQEKVPTKYIEPCTKLPNGDEWYEKHSKGWMMEIGKSCEC